MNKWWLRRSSSSVDGEAFVREWLWSMATTSGRPSASGRCIMKLPPCGQPPSVTFASWCAATACHPCLTDLSSKAAQRSSVQDVAAQSCCHMGNEDTGLGFLELEHQFVIQRHGPAAPEP